MTDPNALMLEILNVPLTLKHNVIWSERGINNYLSNIFVQKAVEIRVKYREIAEQELDKIFLGIRHGGGPGRKRTRGLLPRLLSFLGESFMASTFEGKLLLEGKEASDRSGATLLGRNIKNKILSRKIKGEIQSRDEAYTWKEALDFVYDNARGRLYLGIDNYKNPDFYKKAYAMEYGDIRTIKYEVFSKIKNKMKKLYLGEVR